MTAPVEFAVDAQEIDGRPRPRQSGGDRGQDSTGQRGQMGVKVTVTGRPATPESSCSISGVWRCLPTP